MHQRLMRKIYRFFRSSRYPPDYPPHLDNVKMLPNDRSQPVTLETDGKAFVHRKAKCSIPRNTKGAGRSKTQLLVRFANTVAEQTRINLSQEKPVTQKTQALEKREIYFRWQTQALTDLSARKLDTWSFIGRGSEGYVPKNRQCVITGWGAGRYVCIT